jgi:hypothetical protein
MTLQFMPTGTDKDSNTAWASLADVGGYLLGLDDYFYVTSAERTIYTPASISSELANVSKTGGVIATRFVERFHAVVSGYKDTDGSYGGVGTVIERPDHVIRHFLKTRCGFADADIDSTSFSAAGTAYAGYISGGYKLAFMVDREIRPSEFLKRLAFECRSALNYEAGKWYLQEIPDVSPSALKTITKGELAGQYAKFRFNKTSINDLANSLTAMFSRAYTKFQSESEWLGTSKTSDSASTTKYGEYAEEFEFEAVRAQEMADNVLAHILKQRKTPFLVVEFPVFWEHFDLTVGDTFAIDNPLWNGKKFFIEKMDRQDRGRALVTAIEWW